MAKWFDVEKQLPKKNGDYLTVFQGESGFMALAIFRDGKWMHGSYGVGGEWAETSLVTYWRKAPAWPK